MRTLPLAKYIFSVTIIVLTIAVYFPGLNGPFLFDDYPNIVLNQSLHINELNTETLATAANSLKSGTLGRPLAALSFATNFYFSGNIQDSFAFKITNIIIHIINGLLVFWLTAIILKFVHQHNDGFQKLIKRDHLLVVAGITALFWAVHPMQLTSVLYVVQRMTSMSSMFILLTIICYVKFRIVVPANTKAACLGLVAIFFLCAIFTKETGFLIPIYILTMEVFLFKKVSPWTKLSKAKRQQVLIVLVATLVLSLWLAIEYAMPRYAGRDFTFSERIFTELRVLTQYLSMITIPRLSEYGLFHDDINISQSLTSPWTTAFSLIFLISLFLLAFKYQNRLPLFAFGIVWFFAAHSIESTVLPLEIAHEHRNYLATLGIAFILIQLFLLLQHKTQKKSILIFPAILILALGFSTFTRSQHWQSLETLAHTNIINHSKSARSWAVYAGLSLEKNNFEETISAIQNAVALKPNETAYHARHYLYANMIPGYNNTQVDVLKAIRLNPETSLFINLLHGIDTCIDDKCQSLQQTVENWLRVALEHTDSPRYHYYLGSNLAAQNRYEEALHYIDYSIQNDPGHILPLIKKIQILLKLNRIDAARTEYTKLLTEREYSAKLNTIQRKKLHALFPDTDSSS